MAVTIEELEDLCKYKQILKIPYDELIQFVLDYIRRKSTLMVSFWAVCIFFLGIALIVRFNISGYFHYSRIFLHTILGIVVFPLLIAPVHELLHIIPFYLFGARHIRIKMDPKQYMFYVTAHRHVVNEVQFRIVALVPFILISVFLLFMIFHLPGLWKWSLSLLLFAHATMCAGDFALLNFYALHRGKKIYTWDDADEKMSYFYQEI
jgi:Putative zincin peptidase